MAIARAGHAGMLSPFGLMPVRSLQGMTREAGALKVVDASIQQEYIVAKLTFIAGALVMALASVSRAQSETPTGLTRDQVKAETLRAIRDGDIVQGDLGLKDNELHPERYPARAVPSGTTRAAVRAEFASALRHGDVVQGDLGRTLREDNPARYPAEPERAGLTRAQVRAETRAAIEAGDIQVGDLGQTLAELHPDRYRVARGTGRGHDDPITASAILSAR
jgi:hypothetical protein